MPSLTQLQLLQTRLDIATAQLQGYNTNKTIADSQYALNTDAAQRTIDGLTAQIAALNAAPKA